MPEDPIDQPLDPLVLPRAEHPISRGSVDPDALKVLYRLHRSGFLAFLVGGCVRDLLLGKTPKDFDVATDAHPGQIREIFRNSRLIGRRFRLAHVFFHGGKYIEVSTFRRRVIFDEAGEESVAPPENSFGTPGEDAFRRDITINGIFYNIADFSLVDYVGGLEDLRQGIIRCIGDPEEKFVEDPVRMIRVIRHAARTGFAIEENTYRSLLSHVGRIRECSPARVRDEFLREMREGSARESLRLMIETGMLFALFPAFLAPLQERRERDFFLNAASALDRLSSQEEPSSEEFLLALFLLPFLEFYCPSDRFPEGRQGQADYHLGVRQRLIDILGPLQFPRHAREGAAHLLGSQRVFAQFGPRRNLPLRFVRRPDFPQALRLFELGAQARGEAPPRFSLPAEEKKSRRRRRRKPRKKGPLPAPSGAGKGQEGG